MIMSNFNFNYFFDKNNLVNHPKVQNYGLGAISIITPMQTITRINEPDLLYKIPGLGHHNTTEINIAKKILGINRETNKEKSNIPKGLSIDDFSEWLRKKAMHTISLAQKNEQSDCIENFLNNVIKIHYVSHVEFHSVSIKLPTFHEKYSISKEMYEGILEILKQLENTGISCDEILMDGLFFIGNYEDIKEYSSSLIDPNFTFPFKENIIVEQQIVQKDEGER